jgi:hypothetical protein
VPEISLPAQLFCPEINRIDFVYPPESGIEPDRSSRFATEAEQAEFVLYLPDTVLGV